MTIRKPKKCAAKSCTRTFYPFKSTERVCSITCAIELGLERNEKRYKAETRAMRREANLRDKSYQLDKAQKSFNAFIRERDKYQPCISCGTTDPNLRYDCGHYRTIGARPELRFNEDNAAKQCHYNCNIKRSGNVTEYRINLVKRIGARRVEILEGPHGAQNYTLDQIIIIKNHYRRKLKQLQQDRAA